MHAAVLHERDDDGCVPEQPLLPLHETALVCVPPPQLTLHSPQSPVVYAGFGAGAGVGVGLGEGRGDGLGGATTSLMKKFSSNKRNNLPLDCFLRFPLQNGPIFFFFFRLRVKAE